MSVTSRSLSEAAVIYKHNPDLFLRPSYRISPFATSDVSRVSRQKCNLNINQLLREFFGNREYRLTESGRMAIEVVLEEIGVNKQDLVSIVTTSNNYYVSSCVTSTIEKHCRWNRTIGAETAAILVIHEFGCLYKSVDSLKKYGIPIIEDFAHSFASKNTSSEKFSERLVGDYAVFSLPKFIPIQFGGVVVAPKLRVSKEHTDQKIRACLEAELAEFLGQVQSVINTRKEVFYLLAEKFKAFGFPPFFEYSEGEAPGVFMFKTNLSQEELQNLKIHTQSYGIESSVFYGESAFFIPCHHRLTTVDIDYFYEVVAMFINDRVTHSCC